MNTAFENLPAEKRNRIIQVCVEEFALHGYKGTSTNTITTRADISKGILFHYFKNKKNLYLYIVGYCAEFLFERIMEHGETNSEADTDFFENVKQFVLLKLKTLLLYPDEYQVVMSAVYQPPGVIRDDIMKLFAEKREKLEPINTNYLYKFLKDEELRPGLSREMAIEISMSLFDALSTKYRTIFTNKPNEILDFLNNPEPLLKDLDTYIDVLKHGIYQTPE